MIVDLFTQIVQSVLAVVQRIFNSIWGAVDFSVLYSWLPSDIQAAFAALILILFGLAIFRAIKSILPFF